MDARIIVYLKNGEIEFETLDEVRELRDVLDKMLGEEKQKEYVYVPNPYPIITYPTVPDGNNPNPWTYPTVTWCSTSYGDKLNTWTNSFSKNDSEEDGDCSDIAV